MRWAISGGAGFLGLHLARRLLADGHEVRTLDLAPLDDAELESGVEELRGDVRSERDSRALVDGARILVHAAAALPIQGSRESIRSVNVDGTATLLAAAAEVGVKRVVLVSSTSVYGVPEVHPIHEDDPLAGVGAYGESKIEAEQVTRDFGRRGLDFVIIRPKTFIGPERLGVFEILFDWVGEGRRIYTLGDGSNRYQLLAVEDLVDAIVLAARRRAAAGATLNVGAKEFGTVRSDLQALIDHAGSSSRLTPVPIRPAEVALRALELLRVSPLAEWHYKTAHRDSFVAIERAEEVLGWSPKLSNAEALCRTYDWYLEHRDSLAAAGVTHRVPWNQQALGLLKRIS
jgi:nucleoside-diphosphate-sugar epimerase